MIKKGFNIILFSLLSLSVLAQSDTTDTDDYVIEDPDYVVPFDSLSTKDRMHYSFGMGVGFGKGAHGDFFSTYYKPMISYDVSPRLSVNGGLTYINTSVTDVPVLADYNYQLFSGNISQYNAFVGAEYKLSERLAVGGSIFYDFTAYDALAGTSLDTGNGLENLGFSGYVKYKVNKNLSIQAEVRINYNNPYMNRQNSPFSTSFMGMGTDFLGR